MSKEINISDEKIDYIEANYLKKSDKELAVELELTESIVKSTRYKCGLKKQRQTSNNQLITEDGKKWCWYCNEFHDLSMFNKNKSKPSGHQDECRIANKQITIERNQKLKSKKTNKINYKICEECGEKLEIEMFIKNVSTKDGYSNKCKICMNKNSNKKYKIEGDN